MQFLVQIIYSIRGPDINAFDEQRFDTIDEAAAFVKEYDQGIFTLVSMRMFLVKKPSED